jgi:hypothetical protein
VKLPVNKNSREDNPSAATTSAEIEATDKILFTYLL